MAYFHIFPCVDVQNCTISGTKTAVVPAILRFSKAIWLKNSLNVVYFPNSKRPPVSGRRNSEYRKLLYKSFFC
ncbi:hypothetical protein GH097_23385 [Escherichia coli]|nr:hypothetical protein [Escherichia coli]